MTKLLSCAVGKVFHARNLLLVSILFLSQLLTAQVNTYTFSESTGTYNELVGATTSTAVGDDGTQFNIALPFTFNYGGNDFTAVGVGTNGWLRVGASTSIGTFGAFSNSLDVPTNNINFVAPLWDDLNLTGGTISYQTQGTTPNQIFIMEWKNVRWSNGGSPTAPQQNFQVWLYETTNVVEIRYGAMLNGATPTASIGLVGPTAGDFVSITPGNPATSSTTIANNSIAVATFLTNGLIYTFTPPPPPTCNAPTALTLDAATTTTADISWTSTAGGFEIEYGVAPLTLGSGTLETGITTNSFEFTGLSSGTPYNFFIRADCGVDGFSAWDGPYRFVTNADNNNATCYAATALPIPDNGCGANNFLVFPIEVSGLVGNELGTNVFLDKVDLIISHTWNEDVNVILVSPSGEQALLFGGNFGNGDNFGNPTLCPNGLFTLQAGGLPLSFVNTSNVVGIYAPEESFNLFNDATSANGEWLLAICDNAGGDVGALRYAKLLFNDLCASFEANAGNDVAICEGASTTLTATGGGSYEWSTGETTASITVSPLADETYSVTVSDGNSCSLTDTDDVTVTVNSLPTADAGGDIELCDNAFPYILAATGGVDYDWSNGETTASISINLTADETFSVTVTDANNCTASTSIDVTLKPGTSVDLGNDTIICINASVILDAGVASSYFWSTTETTQTITVTPLTSTTYTITITAANGCIATDAIFVDVNTLAQGLAGLDQEICIGDAAILTATGGTDYVWSNGETTASITVSPTVNTTYSVTITVSGACTTTDDVEVIVNDLPLADAGVDEEICPGGTVTLTALGGTAYEWSTNETSASIDVTPSVKTTYTVTVTDANNCSATASVDVNLFPAVTVDAGIDVDICEGSDATLTVTTNGNDIEWSTGETTASITVSPVANTTYGVTVIGANSCVGSDVVIVNVNPLPSVVLTSNSPICEGDPLVLNSVASGGSFGASSVFNGSNNTPVNIPDFDINGAISPVTITGTGNISVLSTIELILNINHTFASDLDAFLVGPNGCGTLELFTIVGGAGANFTNTVLSTASTNIIGSAGNNTAPFTGTYRPEGLLTGVQNVAPYALPTNGLAGCPIDGQWFLAVVDAEQGDVGTIQNWSLQITNPTTYSHSFTGAGQAGNITLGGILNSEGTVSYNNVPAGENQFSVTVTDGNGCTAEDVTTVKVFAKPLVANIAQSCTSGNDGEITITATLDNGSFTGGDVGVVEYSFDNGNSWSTNNTESNLVTGSYQVVLRNSANTTCETNPLIVVITDAPVVAVINSSPACEGADVTLSTLASGGTATRVYDNNNNISFPIPDGSVVGVSSQITLSGAGNIDANSIVSVNLNVNHIWIEDIDVFLVGPNGCGTLVLTTDNGADGDNYVNTVIATNAANSITTGTPPFTGTFAPEGTLTGTPDLSGAFNGGNYNLPANALDGCPITGDWTLRVFDDESIISGTLVNWSLSVTFPGEYTQSVSGPGVISPVTYSGQSNSVANVTISDAPIGESDYTVTVTDINGCSSSTITTVKVFDVPSNVTFTTECAGALGGSISVTADAIDNANFISNDVGDLEYSYDGGTTWGANSTETGLTAGVYEVYVRNSANPLCQTGPFSVTVFEVPTVVATDLELCIGATVDLTATSPSVVTYEWSTSETTQTITVNADGDYYVTVTDGNSCTATDTATVTPGSSLTVVLADYEFCDGNTVVLDASNPGANYEWSNGETTQTITASTSDTYSVTVTAAGCTGTASSEVVVNPNPADNLVDASICDGDALTLDAGNIGDDFVWSTGETSQTIAVILDDTYAVTITNQFGCETLSESSVTVTALPVVTLSNVTVCEGTAVVLDAGNAGSTYIWSPNGETTQEINVTDSDTYGVTVTDANNCSATALSIVVINDNPIVTITGNITICEGETTNLIGSGTGDYEWSNAETTTAISVTPTIDTDYSLTVTDANGCSATDEVTVVVNANPVASITGDLTPCSTTGTTLTADGGVDYEWNTGAVTAAINVTPQLATVYSVTVTAQNGCTDAESVTIAPVAGPTASAGSDVGVCEGGVITIFGGGGTTYEWSTGATTSNLTVSPLTNTTYTLTVSDPNGCTDSDEITVFVSPAPSVSLSIATDVFCTTDDAETLSASPSGGTLSGTGVTGGDFDPAVAGEGSFILTYTFTDVNQCTAVADVSVAVQTCSSVEELVKALESASVYPNPFMNQINISFVSKDANDVDVRLFDVLGKQIVNETMQVVRGENVLTLSPNAQLAGGVYYLQLVKEDKSVSFRLMKTE